MFFKWAMLITIENLSITKHCDTLFIACICSKVYQPQLQYFLKRDYIYV